MVETQLVDKIIIKKEKVCSAYDEECKDVPNPTKCFLGEMHCGVNFGIADGLCPERGKR